MTTSVAKYYKVPLDTLLNSKRGELNWPRLLVIYLSKEKYAYQRKEIAEAVGHISKVTIGTSANKCSKHLNDNASLLEDVDEIMGCLKVALLGRT